MINVFNALLHLFRSNVLAHIKDLFYKLKLLVHGLFNNTYLVTRSAFNSWVC